MSSIDSPDWSTNVQVQYGGIVTDAPDWVHVVSGPGGGAITGLSSGVSNQPGDLGQIGWTQDYRFADTTTVTLKSGFVYASLVQAVVSAPSTLTNLYLAATGSGLSTTNCNVALYDEEFSTTAALAIGTPSDIAFRFSNFGTPSGAQTEPYPYVTGYPVEVGQAYWVVILVNGTSPPHLGAIPYPAEPGGVGYYDFSAITNVGGFTSIATNAFAASLEAATPMIWATLGPGP